MILVEILDDCDNPNPCRLTATAQVIGQACDAEGITGSAVVLSSNGTGTITYAWSDGGVGSSRSDLAEGDYTVIVTDENGCQFTLSLTIDATLNCGATNPCTISGSSHILSLPCNAAPGAVNIIVEGAQGATTFAWSDGSTQGPGRQDLIAGLYFVTLTDAAGCQAEVQVVLINDPGCTIGSNCNVAITATSTDPSCDNNDGAIQTNFTGATGAVNYAWSDGSTQANRTGLAEGTYGVSVTDAAGCAAATTVTIARPADCGGVDCELVASINMIAAPSCDNNDGSIQVIVSGANGQVTYSWSDGATGALRNNLPEGTYSVFVEDAEGCVAEASIGIAIPGDCNDTPCDLNASIDILEQPSCDNNDGRLRVMIFGTYGSVTYRWNDGSTDEERTNLPEGTYMVTATDDRGCTANAQITINKPADCGGGNPGCPLEASILMVRPPCNDEGVLSAAATGVTSRLMFAWSNGATTPTISGLSAGSYSLTVTDANGCADVANITITRPDNCDDPSVGCTLESTLHVDAQPTCANNDGAISIRSRGVTSVLSFAWSDGFTGHTRTDLPEGTYSVTVTDAGGCTSAASVSINRPAGCGDGPCNIAAAINLVSNPSCDDNDGRVSVNVTGGTAPYVYAWSDGGSTANRNDLPEGRYTVTVTDAANCMSIADITLNKPADCGNQPCQLEAAINVIAQPSCDNNDGQIEVLTSGNFGAMAFVWEDGSSSATRGNLPEGIYAVTVTDAEGCEATASVTIATPADCGGTGCNGSLTEVESQCIDGFAYACLDIPKPTFESWTVYYDGALYDGEIRACQEELTFRYDYGALLGQGYKGPYHLDSWTVNGQTFSGSFDNVDELIVLLNQWDPQGNWTLDPNTQRINGGVSGSNYGDMLIDQLAALNSTAELGVNTIAQFGGTAIGPFGPGIHEIIYFVPNDDCADTILVTVICDDGSGCELSADYAVNVAPCQDNLGSVSLSAAGATGAVTFTWSDGFVGQTRNDMSPGSYSVLARDAENCEYNLAFILTEVDDCVDAGCGGDSYEDTAICSNGQGYACIDILKATFETYQVWVDDSAFGGEIRACNLIETFNYDYGVMLGGGFKGPYELTSWSVNGQTYSGSFDDVIELVDMMNQWDPTGDWRLDQASQRILGGDPNNSYEMISINQLAALNSTVTLRVNVGVTALGSAVGPFEDGDYVITYLEPGADCPDTLYLTVDCAAGTTPITNQGLGSIATNTTVETVTMSLRIGTEETHCLDLSELKGDNFKVYNQCADDGSGAAEFTVVDECLVINGYLAGEDVACAIVCDDYGTCDTTYVYVQVNRLSNTQEPVAEDDNAMTAMNTAIRSYAVLDNDALPTGTIELRISSPAANGRVSINADNTIDYVPNNKFCGDDEVTYTITTDQGTSEATVKFMITCESLTVFNGFSPNGDGVNDSFQILGIESYPNSEVMIFNQRGNQVYHKKGYTNNDGWQGTYKGVDVPGGTYFYIIDNGEGEKTSGYIQINR